MRQIAIVVEGQTEEAFVRQVLDPHLGPDIYLRPIITHTRRAANGTADRGGGPWSGYRNHLRTLVHQRHWAMVTTLIDFYAYPKDAPGAGCHEANQHPSADSCVRMRAAAMAADVPGRWLPFLAVHEMETLVIAAGSLQTTVLGEPDVPGRFRDLINGAGGAERINDGPDTAPSKRVKQVLPDYSKAQDVVEIMQGHDLDEVLELCPNFARWVERLRGWC